MTSSVPPLGLSDTAVLLLAANLTSIPQLSALRALIAGYPNILHFSAVLELLLNILPETTPPGDYVSIVYQLYCGETEIFNSQQIPVSFINDVSSRSEQNLRRSLAAIGLSNLCESSLNTEDSEQLLTQWFFDRARRVEEITGMIDLARRLVLSEIDFPQSSPPFPPVAVRIWGTGIIQVLERFVIDNNDEDALQLPSFENLEWDSVIRLLLSRTTPDNVSQNVEILIQPFMEFVRYRQPDIPESLIWDPVWEWFLNQASIGNLGYISNLGRNWIGNEGHGEILEQFLRVSLTACYCCLQSSPSIRSHLHQIHQNIFNLLKLNNQFPVAPDSLKPIEMGSLSQLRDSPLTTSGLSSLEYLELMISSADIIAQSSVASELSIRDIVNIREGSMQTQIHLIDRILSNEGLKKKRNDEQWKTLRQSLKWLQSQSHVLDKVSEQIIDIMILSSLLNALCISLFSTKADSSICLGQRDVCCYSCSFYRHTGKIYPRCVLSVL
jgi:Secretory pathway protein Sec39